MSKKTAKMTPIPKRINIGPYGVEVFCDEDKMHGERVKNEVVEAVGFCSTDTQEIFLDPNQGSDSMADTLLHEVLHYIFYITGGTNEFGNENEEKMIMHISSTLLDTLRRNPKMTRYLLGE